MKLQLTLLLPFIIIRVVTGAPPTTEGTHDPLKSFDEIHKQTMQINQLQAANLPRNETMRLFKIKMFECLRIFEEAISWEENKGDILFRSPKTQEFFADIASSFERVKALSSAPRVPIPGLAKKLLLVQAKLDRYHKIIKFDKLSPDEIYRKFHCIQNSIEVEHEFLRIMGSNPAPGRIMERLRLRKKSCEQSWYAYMSDKENIESRSRLFEEIISAQSDLKQSHSRLNRQIARVTC